MCRMLQCNKLMPPMQESDVPVIPGCAVRRRPRNPFLLTFWRRDGFSAAQLRTIVRSLRSRPGMTADMRPRPRGMLHPSSGNHRPSKIRRRRESRARASTPAALRAKIENTQVSHHRSTGNVRPVEPAFPAQWFERSPSCSPVIGLFVTVASAMRKHCRSRDLSVERSGPHDFAVRCGRVRLCAPQASIASCAQRFVTIAKRPS
jgi:hypothetical protein